MRIYSKPVSAEPARKLYAWQLERKRNAAFEEWRKKLRKDDRLPRGRFFVGKKPGREKIQLSKHWVI